MVEKDSLLRAPIFGKEQLASQFITYFWKKFFNRNFMHFLEAARVRSNLSESFAPEERNVEALSIRNWFQSL